ncbi:MAG: SGNH/GDSL hydrolase family protein [Actinobacteria bacterium]|nr:SGNH/GDSL hydrolase family protein [Actinomycetota bacterium]
MATSRKRVLLRIVKSFGFLLTGAVVLLVAEFVYTLKRDFPLTDPEQPVAGEFGDSADEKLKFVVLGDSTTVGVGTTAENSFPWLLARWLARSFRVTLEVVGFGGATTADLGPQVDKALQLDPDLILVEIGANDTTHLTPIFKVRKNMAETLDRLSKSDADVVVVGPPHMGTSPIFLEPLRTLTGLRGDMVRRAIEDEANKRGLAYVDLAAGTREAFETEPDKYYSSDWFHPGAAGYKLWAEVMYPTVLKAAQS